MPNQSLEPAAGRGMKRLKDEWRANVDARHRRRSPEGKRATEPGGEGVSIMKAELKAKRVLAGLD